MRAGSPSIYYGEVHVAVSSLQSEQAGLVKTYKLEKRRGCMHAITGRLSVSFNLSLDLASMAPGGDETAELRRSGGGVAIDMRRSAGAMELRRSGGGGSAFSLRTYTYSHTPSTHTLHTPSTHLPHTHTS